MSCKQLGGGLFWEAINNFPTLSRGREEIRTLGRIAPSAI